MEILKIPNQIINGALTPLNLNKVDAIVLHHTAHPTADVKTVEQWHISKGWTAIGYNYWIDFDGNIYEGRGLNTGAGVAGHNSHIINVCVQGDYDTAIITMPEKQFLSVVNIIMYLKSHLSNDVMIAGHRYFGGTVCPGKYFPLFKIENEVIKMLNRIEELENRVKRLEEAETKYNWTTACPEWSRPYVQKAIDTGILKGDEKGQLGLTDAKIFSLVMDLRSKGIME